LISETTSTLPFLSDCLAATARAARGAAAGSGAFELTLIFSGGTTDRSAVRDESSDNVFGKRS
jgi:hypothetical protein